MHIQHFFVQYADYCCIFSNFYNCSIKYLCILQSTGWKGLSITLDGKPIRSAGRLETYDGPLYMIGAQIFELSITFASKSV